MPARLFALRPLFAAAARRAAAALRAAAERLRLALDFDATDRDVFARADFVFADFERTDFALDSATFAFADVRLATRPFALERALALALALDRDATRFAGARSDAWRAARRSSARRPAAMSAAVNP